MSSRKAVPVLLLVVFAEVWLCSGEYTSQSVSLRIDTLLATYDREVPPSATDGGVPVPVPVTVTLDVRHATVDDKRAVMRLLADLKMKWNDSRLSWNATEWQTESALVWAERLWRPDVALVSGGSAGGAGAGALRARLHAAGAVSLVARLDLSVPLALDLRRWPHDEQMAAFKFASTEHSDAQIQLVITQTNKVPGSLSNVDQCGAWDVVVVTDAVAAEARAGGGAVSVATWRVHVRRRAAALAVAAGAVLAAAALLLAASAALPADTRAPLDAAAAFLTATWMVAAIFHMPAAGSCPRVVGVMCAACVCGAAHGAAAALTARLARRRTPPPAALRALLSRISAVYEIAPDPDAEASGKSGAWCAAARLLDAAVSGVLLITLLVLAAVYVFA